jgi:hypothetical protein
MTQIASGAAEIDPAPMPEKPAAVGHFLVHRLVKGASQLPARPAPPIGESALSRAIARAVKKDFIERGVEESAEILIQCQKAQSVVLTSPFMRSDSQQAHCFRF